MSRLSISLNLLRMKPPFTKRQRAILEWVRDQLRTNGYPPTMNEIAAEFGFSSQNAVYCHLRAIERKGYVRRVPNIARGLVLL